MREQPSIPESETGAPVTEDLADVPERDPHDTILHRATDTLQPQLPETEEEIRELRDAFRHSPEIKSYRRGHLPIETLESVPEYIEQQARREQISGDERDIIHEELNAAITEVTQSCTNYGSRVREYEMAIREAGSTSRENLQAEIGRWDRARKASHEVVLDAFRRYNRFVSNTLYTKHHINVPHSMLFPEVFIQDRNRGGAWALTTDYFLRARNLIDSLEKKEVA